MAFPLPEDFKPGAALRDLVTTEIMRTVTGILNHLTVEVRDGVDYPYIEKTARPGEQQPWVIVLPAAMVAGLSNAVPAKDSGEGDPGESEDAARADHSHPVNMATNANYEPLYDGFNTDSDVWDWFGGADIGKGAQGDSGKYSDIKHTHVANAIRDDNVSPAGGTPYPIGSHLFGDLVDSLGDQVMWAARYGVTPWYAASDHVHPDRVPVAVGTSAYTFKNSSYAYNRNLSTGETTSDANAFLTRDGERWNLPIVTRVALQLLPQSGDTMTGVKVFSRMLTFDYSGRLVGMGPEAATGFSFGV
jgi:hypothetical protein